jgi:hypothetical protein
MYISIFTYIDTFKCIYIHKADANAAAKELADAAHVCGRILTYAEVCRNRRPQPQEEA